MESAQQEERKEAELEEPCLEGKLKEKSKKGAHVYAVTYFPAFGRGLSTPWGGRIRPGSSRPGPIYTAVIVTATVGVLAFGGPTGLLIPTCWRGLTSWNRYP